jgi:GH25 family lysozyme M1 (1,4-beta-N-acetylmuramidase)
MTTLPGIDVSGIGQGAAFNWEQYRGRIAFAFAKATEALNFRDPDFPRNWAAAAELDIIRGAYHFLHPELSGAKQADFFLSAVDPDPGDLVMVDVETVPLLHDKPMSAEEVSACVAGFIDIVRAKTGAWPVVYADQWMARNGYLASAGQCPAFIANPTQVPLFPPIGPWRLISFMQVGQRGIDTDEFFGDLGELRRLTVSRRLPPPEVSAAAVPAAAAPAMPATVLGIGSDRAYAPGETPQIIWLKSADGGKTYQPA